MNKYKPNNYVPALAGSLNNSIGKLYNDVVANIGTMNKEAQFRKMLYVDPIIEGIKDNVKGTIENIKEKPFGTIARVGCAVLGAFGAYELLETIDANIPEYNLSIGSQVKAAETKPNVLEYLHDALNLRDEEIAENKILREQRDLVKSLSKTPVYDLINGTKTKRIKISAENLEDLIFQLGMSSDMKSTYTNVRVQNKQADIYNIITNLEYENDGNMELRWLPDGRLRINFDRENKPKDITEPLSIEKLVILTLTSETKTNHKIAYRIYNEETSEIRGWVLAQKELEVEERDNGVILGTPIGKPKKTEPVTPDNGDNGDNGDQNGCGDVGNIVDNETPVIDESQDDTTPGADYTGDDYFDFTKDGQNNFNFEKIVVRGKKWK